MSTQPSHEEAAGGVLWRQAHDDDPASTEVALVHRPAYDDWSLPKGKLDAGEHPVLCALREIEEETGFVATPGRPLGELLYPLGNRPKRVRYWACRASAGAFTVSSEVDELRWLPVEEALGILPAARDRPVLDRFAADTRATRALLVVRHASAGDRATWAGDDRDRPLDRRGQRQAAALVALLRAYDVGRAVTADALRCRETLAPLAAATGLTVTVEPTITAGCFEEQPEAGVEAVLALAAEPPAVVCGQREVIADLLAGVRHHLGDETRPGAVGQVDKAGAVVLHLEVGRREPVLVATERLPAP